MDKIEIGAVYLTGRGAEACIAGPTKFNAEWVWSIQGNWYRQSDGRSITYTQDKTTGEWSHHPIAIETGLDLVKKIKDSWK